MLHIIKNKINKKKYSKELIKYLEIVSKGGFTQEWGLIKYKEITIDFDMFGLVSINNEDETKSRLLSSLLSNNEYWILHRAWCERINSFKELTKNHY